MKIRLNWLSLALGVAVIGSGCEGERYPDTPPGASRAMLENPLGAAAAAKTAKKPSAKEEAAIAANKAAAQKNDPRGK